MYFMMITLFLWCLYVLFWSLAAPWFSFTTKLICITPKKNSHMRWGWVNNDRILNFLHILSIRCTLELYASLTGNIFSKFCWKKGSHNVSLWQNSIFPGHLVNRPTKLFLSLLNLQYENHTNSEKYPNLDVFKNVKEEWRKDIQICSFY